MTTEKPPKVTIEDLLDGLTKTRIFNHPLHTKIVPGSGKLCLVLGDNATGKSVIRRLVHILASKRSMEQIGLSVEGRTKSGIERLMIYGSEDDQSTGANTIHTTEAMIRTSRSRTAPHVVYMDEPDTGLSDRWARSLGRELLSFMENSPENLMGMFITSHRVCLVKELVALNPHVILVGAQWPTSLQDWLDGDSREPEPISNLNKQGDKLYADIQKLIIDR